MATRSSTPPVDEPWITPGRGVHRLGTTLWISGDKNPQQARDLRFLQFTTVEKKKSETNFRRARESWVTSLR
jgi:hypothetical protein